MRVFPAAHLVLAIVWLLGSMAAAAEPMAGPFSHDVQPFLKQYCYKCHGPTEQQSRIRYDQLAGFAAQDRYLWTLVHEQLSSRAMPPQGHPRPTSVAIQSILTWIESQQRALGQSSTRRLNRREISSALQDVTGLTVDFAYALPGDGKVDGFDTGAEGLQDAADSVAQVMQVARRAVEGLQFRESASKKVYAADVRDAKDARKVFDAWKAEGVSASTGDVVSQPGTGWLIKPKWLGDRGGLTIRIPPPANRAAILRLRIAVSVQKFVAGVPNPHLWVEMGGRDIAYLEICNGPDEPRTFDFQVPLSDVTADAKGLAITLCNRVEVPYAIYGLPNEERTKLDENIPGGTGLFRPLFDAKTKPLPQQPIPFVVLHSFEIEPDYCAHWPPQSWYQTADVNDLTDDRASAERLLQLWIERAWRRRVLSAEQARFLALYDKLHGQGMPFDEALRATFQSVLLAGPFRYLSAPGRDVDRAHYAIASRLSFMLWGAPPDEGLLTLAAGGRLRDPDVLDAQIQRMLADPRSAGFIRPFVTQWLEMGQPITLGMDHIQKQDFRFGRNLKASMQEETIAYVGRMITENRPARELIASDWTMMNEILARHYGYDGIAGGALRPVTLRSDDPRGGGILGQAGLQSMLCWMGDNWVIYRGAWTLRRILDDPPPPPPLEVPELLPSDAMNHGKTFKQLLAQHQEDVRCAVCHKSIDPLGFAFQNFDLSGRWRQREFDNYARNELDGKIEWHGAGKDRPVDTTGRLPRGEAFETFAECKELLVKHYLDDIVRGLLKNLVLYGGARKADVDDLSEIRQIMAAHKPRGYPLRELIQAVAKSQALTAK